MTDRGICFIALNGYAALAGRDGVEHVGGAERQMAILARELARRGRRVTFVTKDGGKGEDGDVAGVRVLTAYREDAGLPGFRFVHPRCTGLWRAMRKADADVYYQRMAEQTTGIVAAFCSRNGRRFVFAAASDYDCLSALPRLHKRRERWMYRDGLRRADVVLAQTEHQRKLLSEGFGVTAQVLPNAAIDLAHAAGAALTDVSRQDRTPPRVLWVGRFTPEKRVEWVIEVAKHSPNVRFDIVGDGPADDVDKVRRTAAALTNVRLHGRVPHENMKNHYAAADVLLCTSEKEGFPNTFLEAWCFGVPVVTTFDPDGVVAMERLGAVAFDVQGISQKLQTMANSPEDLGDMGQRCRHHFLKHHGVSRVVDRFEMLIKHV